MIIGKSIRSCCLNLLWEHTILCLGFLYFITIKIPYVYHWEIKLQWSESNYQFIWNFINVINVSLATIKYHIYKREWSCCEHIWVFSLLLEQMRLVPIQWIWYWILAGGFIGSVAFGRLMSLNLFFFFSVKWE